MNISSELTSLRAHVRQYIVDGISIGTFKPGDKISEQELADALGVSRTPIRETLLQLNSEGLLEYFPRRGFSIKCVSAQEKQDFYQLIAALDSYCARVATSILDENDFRSMHEMIDKIDISIKYRNTEEYRVLQMKLHDIYRKKVGNEAILKILSNVESGLVPQTFVGDDLDQMAEIYAMLNDEHRHILALMEARDALGVETYLLETHWAERFPQLTETNFISHTTADRPED